MSNFEFNQYLVYVRNKYASFPFSSFPHFSIYNQYRWRDNNCGGEGNDDEGPHSSVSGSFYNFTSVNNSSVNDGYLNNY